MATKTPATAAPTMRLRRCWASDLDGPVGDIAPQPDQGDDEDQDHEQDEPERQRDVAAAPGLHLGLALVSGLAHPITPPRDFTSGFAPIRCSPSRVAKSRLR